MVDTDHLKRGLGSSKYFCYESLASVGHIYVYSDGPRLIPVRLLSS